ncbi:MAG: hypothetical protein ACFFCD_06805 [Promethearchaeota archaeon]
MSRVFRFCRKCGGSIVPGARFCNRCGTPVDSQGTFPTPAEPISISKTEENETSLSESLSHVEVSLKEEEIPAEEFERIVATYNIWKLDEQLKPLNMKLEELRVKREVEGLPEEEYLSEVGKLENEKKRLEKELSEKKDVDPLRVYSLIPEECKATERLNKLEKIFEENKISQTTYAKLKREYAEKLQVLRHDLVYERQKLNKWKRILEKKMNDTKMSLEELQARYEIGEVSEGEYIPKKSDLEARRKDLKNSLTLINYFSK